MKRGTLQIYKVEREGTSELRQKEKGDSSVQN